MVVKISDSKSEESIQSELKDTYICNHNEPFNKLKVPDEKSEEKLILTNIYILKSTGK